jgi:rod shape-determining protein MreB
MGLSFPFFKSKRIGIDLGTANTLIYSKKHQKIVLNEPSVVAIEKETRKVLAVGNEAKEMIGKAPKSIIPVKPLSEGVIADYDITYAMLKHFIRKVFGSYNFFLPEIMLCVPIDVTSVEKRTVLEAAISAGAKTAYLIEEARAAALGAGLDISAPEGNMIIDIGGGSTDVAILSLGCTVVSRTIRIAGTNFDNDIIKYVKKTHNLQIGERTAEDIKIKIGTALQLDEEENMLIKGRNLIMGLPKSVTISSEEVREAMMESLMEIVECVKSVLEQAPPELASDIIDNGIVMTGGGSLIRNFPKMVSKYTNLPVTLADSPLESVVRGAGLALDQLDILKRIDRAVR